VAPTIEKRRISRRGAIALANGWPHLDGMGDAAAEAQCDRVFFGRANPASRLLLPDQTSILFFRHAVATSRHILDTFAIEVDQMHFVKSALTNFEPFP
jgi:hypothetical protein